ncbi:MAG TPA: hypothetical protein VGM66_05800 [Candidatus Udaeobacter sp.]|jgi:hypothetical protein
MHILKSTILAVCCSLTLAALAQDNPAPPTAATPPAAGDTPAATLDNGQAPRQRRANLSPADYQARMMNRLRERLEITDDAEWQLISERIAKVTELRRSAFAGAMRVRGGAGGNGPNAGQANPEQDALVSAVTDKLPDAEIKARLERLRAARKISEAKLDQAREDLRAVLTIRQEAIMVLAGILP